MVDLDLPPPLMISAKNLSFIFSCKRTRRTQQNRGTEVGDANLLRSEFIFSGLGYIFGTIFSTEVEGPTPHLPIQVVGYIYCVFTQISRKKQRCGAACQVLTV